MHRDPVEVRTLHINQVYSGVVATLDVTPGNTARLRFPISRQADRQTTESDVHGGVQLTAAVTAFPRSQGRRLGLRPSSRSVLADPSPALI